jgi:predicted MFS family arabinose efflux permease
MQWKILAMVAILGNLISPYLPRLAREGTLFTLHWSLSISLAMLLGLGPRSEPLLWVSVLWMDFLGSAVWIYTFHARQVLVPRENLAGVNAIARAMLLLAYSLGSFIYRPLGERFGIQAAMALQALPLMVGLGIWLGNRNLRGLELART